jgi:hypothetical protein
MALMNWLALWLIIINALIAIYTVYINSGLKNRLQMPIWQPAQSTVLYILIVIILIISMANLFQEENIKELEKRISANSGEITAKSIAFYPCLTFGGNTVIGKPDGLSIVDLTNGLSFGPQEKTKNDFHQNESDKILVWVDNGKLKASAAIKDKEGRILARINGNEWSTAQKPLIYDRNYDDMALEVVDAYQHVILQIEMIGECARVSGVFYNGLGTVFINDNGVFINPSQNISINPIFAYPSEMHFGERILKI